VEAVQQESRVVPPVSMARACWMVPAAWVDLGEAARPEVLRPRGWPVDLQQGAPAWMAWPAVNLGRASLTARGAPGPIPPDQERPVPWVSGEWQDGVGMAPPVLWW
jgi:hypothetical protein